MKDVVNNVIRAEKSVKRLLSIPLLIAVSTLFMISYIYLIPPLSSPILPDGVPSWFSSLGFGSLEGDLKVYLWRFFLTFVFFGVLPFLMIVALGYKPGEVGLRFDFRNPRGAGFVFTRTFALIIVIAVLSGIVGSLNSSIFDYYPYSKTLAGHIASFWRGGAFFKGSLLLVLHGLLYFFFYYVPWEFFFRGVLIFPLLEAVPGLSRSINRGEFKPLGPLMLIALSIAAFQIIPSTMVHVGHPFVESLAAIVYGLYAAFITVYTRSIVPSLLTHFTVGFFTDLFIVLRMTFFGG